MVDQLALHQLQLRLLAVDFISALDAKFLKKSTFPNLASCDSIRVFDSGFTDLEREKLDAVIYP